MERWGGAFPKAPGRGLVRVGEVLLPQGHSGPTVATPVSSGSHPSVAHQPLPTCKHLARGPSSSCLQCGPPPPSPSSSPLLFPLKPPQCHAEGGALSRSGQGPGAAEDPCHQGRPVSQDRGTPRRAQTSAVQPILNHRRLSPSAAPQPGTELQLCLTGAPVRLQGQGRRQVSVWTDSVKAYCLPQHAQGCSPGGSEPGLRAAGANSTTADRRRRDAGPVACALQLQTVHSAPGMPRLEQPFQRGKWDEPSEKDLGETLRNSRQAGGEIPAEVTREQTGDTRAVKVGCQGPERPAPGPGPHPLLPQGRRLPSEAHLRRTKTR